MITFIEIYLFLLEQSFML